MELRMFTIIANLEGTHRELAGTAERAREAGFTAYLTSDSAEKADLMVDLPSDSASNQGKLEALEAFVRAELEGAGGPATEVS